MLASLRTITDEARASDPAAWPDTPGGPAYTSEEVDSLLDEMRSEH